MTARIDVERQTRWEVLAEDCVPLWMPPVPKRKFRRFTKRKQRRREEQAAIDSVYRLHGTMGLRSMLLAGISSKQKHLVWREVYTFAWRPSASGAADPPPITKRTPKLVVEPAPAKHRAFCCPRCEGHCNDPEHDDGGSFNVASGEGEPPGPVPCELCGGEGVVDHAMAGTWLTPYVVGIDPASGRDVTTIAKLIVDPNVPEGRVFLLSQEQVGSCVGRAAAETIARMMR